jgi:hypothetical protein
MVYPTGKGVEMNAKGQVLETAKLNDWSYECRCMVKHENCDRGYLVKGTLTVSVSFTTRGSVYHFTFNNTADVYDNVFGSMTGSSKKDRLMHLLRTR